MFDRDLICTLGGWFGFLVSAAFGNPVPEEVMIVSAGVHTASMEHQGAFRWLVLPTVLVGAFVADLLLYGLGRVLGARLLESNWMRALSPPEKRRRIHDNFHRYGFVIFAIGRLVPGIRTTLFLTAGAMRISLLRFALADGVGAVVGGSLFFLLGFGLGSQFAQLIQDWEDHIQPYKTLFVVCLLVLTLGYLGYLFLRHPIPTGDPEEVPLIGRQVAVHLPDKEPKPSDTLSGAEEAPNASQTNAEEKK